MKKYIVLNLILLNIGVLFGQDVPVDTTANFVIANGGLNLRSEPSVKSKKITNIPFGSTIKYLSNESYNVDTIVRHIHTN